MICKPFFYFFPKCIFMPVHFSIINTGSEKNRQNARTFDSSFIQTTVKTAPKIEMACPNKAIKKWFLAFLMRLWCIFNQLIWVAVGFCINPLRSFHARLSNYSRSIDFDIIECILCFLVGRIDCVSAHFTKNRMESLIIVISLMNENIIKDDSIQNDLE